VAPQLPQAPGADVAAGLPEFDENGKLVSKGKYEETTQFRRLGSGVASVQVLSSWVQKADSSLTDPVQGPTATLLSFSQMDTKFSKLSDIGKIEKVPLTSTLGLDDELKRADMVAAATRKSGENLFYEYDLALPARECVPELATACLPERVILLSSCIRDGTLHVLRVDANPSQWRRAGKALQLMRSSFEVEDKSDAA